MPHHTKHLTIAQVEQIAELHRSGRNTGQIAALIPCSVDQVRHSLKRKSLKPCWSRNGRCYQHADELREWASQGVSLCEMGRRIGTGHSKIAAFLDRHGIARVRFDQSGENNPAWKGGRQIDKDGYVLVLQSEHPAANRHGYVREHRVVMEDMLGRFLTSDEVVHHKDDDHGNNDPGNLQLFATNAEHLSATIKGQHPEWTEAGLQKIRERWSRLGAERKAASRSCRRAQDGRWSPETSDPKPG